MRFLNWAVYKSVEVRFVVQPSPWWFPSCDAFEAFPIVLLCTLQKPLFGVSFLLASLWWICCFYFVKEKFPSLIASLALLPLLINCIDELVDLWRPFLTCNIYPSWVSIPAVWVTPDAVETFDLFGFNFIFEKFPFLKSKGTILDLLGNFPHKYTLSLMMLYSFFPIDSTTFPSYIRSEVGNQQPSRAFDVAFALCHLPALSWLTDTATAADFLESCFCKTQFPESYPYWYKQCFTSVIRMFNGQHVLLRKTGIIAMAAAMVNQKMTEKCKGTENL